MENKTEYIKKSDAELALWQLRKTYRRTEEICAVGGCIVEIQDIPAEDVAPVIHAKWIFVNDRCGCSNCRLCLSYDGNGVIIDMSHLPYCPHCGARMEGTELEWRSN